MREDDFIKPLKLNSGRRDLFYSHVGRNVLIASVNCHFDPPIMKCFLFHRNRYKIILENSMVCQVF